MNKHEEELYFRAHGLEVRSAKELNAMLERRLSLDRTEANSAEAVDLEPDEESEGPADE